MGVVAVVVVVRLGQAVLMGMALQPGLAVQPGLQLVRTGQAVCAVVVQLHEVIVAQPRRGALVLAGLVTQTGGLVVSVLPGLPRHCSRAFRHRLWLWEGLTDRLSWSCNL